MCSYGVDAFMGTPNSSGALQNLFMLDVFVWCPDSCIHCAMQGTSWWEGWAAEGCLHVGSGEVVWGLEQHLAWQPLDPCDLLDPLKKPFQLAS